MKTITLSVPQGVGDIFWIYQKFSPYFDLINLNVLHVNKDPVQTRAKNFLSLLPKCGEINYHLVSSSIYNDVVKHTPKLSHILDSELAGAYVAYNVPLESGVRLEDIDPGYEVEWSVPVTRIECPLEYEDFICVYVSGSLKDNGSVWSVEQWKNFILTLCSQYEIDLPIIVIGAKYDRDVGEPLAKILRSSGREVKSYYDSCPMNVTYILEKAKLFIGYQSGLNVLADNFDTPQVMLYFPWLISMLNTWAKQSNIDKNIFNADVFSKSPYEVLSNLKLNWKG